jgi:serine/threonine protein kinase
MQLLQPNMLIQGRYQVIQMVGRGGMGAVYRARDLRLNTVVAIKQTLLSGAQIDQAFEREAQLLASLRHQSLPKVMDHFIDPAGQFLVMEFIEGNDLGTLVEGRAIGLPVVRVTAWAEQLLRTLEYLHGRQRPVIHRDIKPQNLKLSDDVIVLLDFGLAKGLAAAHPGVTAGSTFGYTQQYAPLEQIQGQGTDARSDLFSAAGTLYHLFTGVPPTDALTRAATIISREPDPLVPIHHLNPSIPAGARDAIMAGLALHREDRPVSAAAMRMALHTVTGETVRLPTGPAPGQVAAPLPPSIDLHGSSWEIGYSEGGAGPFETIRVRFAPDGDVQQLLTSGPGRVLGRWRLQYDQISFDINGFSQWVGTVNTHGMRGTATTTTTRWVWSAIPVR